MTFERVDLSPDVTLYRGDCLEVLPMLEAGSVDAVVTDPPYLVTDLDFDEDLSFEWVEQCVRVVQNNGYLASFGLSEVQRHIEALWHRRFTGIWLKASAGMRTHSAKMPMCQQEPFVVYAHKLHKISKLVFNTVYRSGEKYKKVMRNNGYKRGGSDQLDRANSSSWTKDGLVIENSGRREMTDVLFAPAKTGMAHSERTEHPTQKPLEVMTVIIQWLTNPSMTILDPFMGSGTTGVAAVKLGRRFIGIEIDPNYFEIARRRIEDALAQPPLFRLDASSSEKADQQTLF